MASPIMGAGDIMGLSDSTMAPPSDRFIYQAKGRGCGSSHGEVCRARCRAVVPWAAMMLESVRSSLTDFWQG